VVPLTVKVVGAASLLLQVPWAPGDVEPPAAMVAFSSDGEVRLRCLGDVQHAGAMAGSL